MGRYLERTWLSAQTFGLSRRDREGGKYFAFIPDLLGEVGPGVGVAAFSRIADAQSAVSRADGIVGESGLYLNHLLLRSESISSSRIEGYAVSPKNLALADVLHRGKGNAREVIQNLRATEYAIEQLAEQWDFTVDDLVALQQTIAPHLPAGVRTEQNWIGGVGNSPIRAAYVPPPEDQVIPLLEDLLLYVNSSEHPPLLKAAIAHAQFEIIHPFIDGNGRTGRALIHAILKRDKVTENALLPISTVFAGQTGDYLAGLTAFRQGVPKLDDWVEGFAAASVQAAQKVIQVKERATEVDAALLRRLRHARELAGVAPNPRDGSTVTLVLASLTAAPVVTVGSVQDRFRVSRSAAELALNELADAGVLSRSKDHRGAIAAYVSDEHLNLVTLAERSIQVGGQDTAYQRPEHAPPVPESSFRWDSEGKLIDTRFENPSVSESPTTDPAQGPGL